MQCVFECGAHRTLGFAAITRCSTKTELESRAHARDMPIETTLREQTLQSLLESHCALLHRSVSFFGVQVRQCCRERREDERIGGERGAHAGVTAVALREHGAHARFDLGCEAKNCGR